MTKPYGVDNETDCLFAFGMIDFAMSTLISDRKVNMMSIGWPV